MISSRPTSRIRCRLLCLSVHLETNYFDEGACFWISGLFLVMLHVNDRQMSDNAAWYDNLKYCLVCYVLCIVLACLG